MNADRRTAGLLPLFIIAMVLLAGVVVALPQRASAHAELIEADPPIDGLVIAPPEQITLNFTEDVAANNPAPVIRLLDAQGNEQPVTVHPPEGKTLTVDVPALQPGVWTVNWSVRSDTDGHQLSGTYAFRIGGGIPAGAATTSGETPEPWAVVARWLTFFGAAVAAAGFLFGFVDPRERVPVRRLAAIIVGALAGMLATLAEPVMLWLSPPNDTDISFGQALRSLPDAWWIRAPALAAAVLIGAIALYVLHRKVPNWLVALGTIASLGSLLGLSFTSHAAGRDSWREVAVASDVLHQWSVALWVGGLLHLVLAWPFEGNTLRTFSKHALWLFTVGVATGVANSAFVFPELDAIWNSDYGYVLIAKVAVLLIPLALAIYHRRAIAKLVTIPRIIRQTLRIEVIAAIVVLLGGAAMALSAPPIREASGPEDITLLQFERDREGNAVGLVHLNVTPVEQGDNEFELWLTDLQGNIAVNDPAPRISLRFTSLDHSTESAVTNLEPTDPATLRYAASGLNLSLDGWWQIDATISRSGQQNTSTFFYVLLPDPNIHGSSSAPSPDEDPAARELFNKAIATMQSQPRFQWIETINTGRDTMVAVELSQIAESPAQPASVEQTIIFSGSFVPRSDGSMPPTPTQNTYHSVTIGEESWLQQQNGDWLSQPTGSFAPISEWGSIYEQASYLRLGGTTEIDGETVQLITFHTPNQAGQSEAWFAWWIGVDTGKVYRLGMVARAHYMTWEYSGFDGNFTITPPTTTTDPSATPAS